MAPTTHQTIGLTAGKHRSPTDGACVMELASMLAGEPFTDHPASVCPVIGSFLRAYNDSIDHRRRQDLYAYAAKVVGSRGSRRVEQARADRLRLWTSAHRRRRWVRFLFPQWLFPRPPLEGVGAYAVRAISGHDDQSHAEALALVDELLTIGGDEYRPPLMIVPPGWAPEPPERVLSA